VKYTFDEIPSIFMRDKPIFSSERILRKNYYDKGSVEKESVIVSLKAFETKVN
jgi:hypothetical protein